MTPLRVRTLWFGRRCRTRRLLNQNRRRRPVVGQATAAGTDPTDLIRTAKIRWRIDHDFREL
jgi:hypothetical protein